jgi:uncharacterized membrane protein
MSLIPVKSNKKYSEIKIAIVIAVIVGICLACAIIIFEIRTERFSAVYINPDTYSNYPENGTISFVYGINSNELTKTSYTIYLRAGGTLVDTKTIELMPHEQYEERKVMQLPEDVAYPVKISVQYISPYENNEVFFRVRNATAIN